MNHSAQSALQQLLEGRNLNVQQMTDVMASLMAGEVDDALIGALLVALRMKGETVEEISAAAKVMRQLSNAVQTNVRPLIDTCGTGGDSLHTFNISTATAFVVAAAGGYVAKHGNRSVSSSTGSADVLEYLGVNISLNAEQVRECIEELNIGFMFAPQHHRSMKHVIGARKALGVRTIFNLLGPLTNPAGAQYQVLGVFDKEWLEPLARVTHELGVERAMIVHADDGLDEISISATTSVVECHLGQIRAYQIDPREFDIQLAQLEEITVDGVQKSGDMIRWIFAGERGAGFDIVCLNAAAALYCAGISADLNAAVELARDAILSGAAAAKLEQLAAKTQQFDS